MTGKRFHETHFSMLGVVVGSQAPNKALAMTDVVFLLTTFGLHAVAFILGPMTYRPDCLGMPCREREI